MYTRKFLLSWTVLFLTNLPLVAAEIDSEWSAAANGNWNDGNNWSTAPTFPNNTVSDQFNVTINPNGSPLEVMVNTNVTINSLSLFDDGTLSIPNNQRLGIAGDSLQNSGLISINSNGNPTGLIVGNRVELSGAGIVELGNGAHPANSRISSTTNGTLVNIDNRIQGRGNLGVNTAGFENLQNGIINANFDQNSLLLDPANDLTFRNQGTIQASNGGTLVLVGTANAGDGGSFQNQDGLIVANAASQVHFSNANVVGGRIGSEPTGEVRVAASSNSFAKDIEFFGTTIVENNSDFGLTGTIQNNGEIHVASTGNAQAFRNGGC